MKVRAARCGFLRSAWDLKRDPFMGKLPSEESPQSYKRGSETGSEIMFLNVKNWVFVHAGSFPKFDPNLTVRKGTRFLCK